MDIALSVIIVAGGKGLRLGTKVPKQFLPFAGKRVIDHSIDLFLSLPYTREIIIACDETYHASFPTYAALKFSPSGERRQDSVYYALQMASPISNLIAIHDAARPLLRRDDAHAAIIEAATSGASALAVPAKNTIKEVLPDGTVVATLDRTKLWEMQTPQVARPDLLKEGFAIAERDNLTVTDDIALVELTHHPVKLTRGSYTNIKLTTPEDWTLLEAYYDTAEV